MKAFTTTHVVLAVAHALCCGCSSSDSTPTREAPPAASPPPVGLEQPAALEPPAPSEPSAPAEAAPAEPTPPLPDAPPIPGFVLYTLEQTIILPLDGSSPTLAPGLWVQDDRVNPPSITHALVLSPERTEALALPGCPCSALSGACDQDGIQLRRFDPRTGALLDDQSDDDCACIRQPDVHGFPPFVADDGRAFPACQGESDKAIVSLVGGLLYSIGWDWNGACGDSLSVYDAMNYDLALVADPLPPELTSDGMRLVGCYAMDAAVIEWPWPVGRGGEKMEPDDCELDESDIFMIRRGQLWNVRDSMGHAGGWRSFHQRPARPDDCPTINDACGDPEPFRTVAKLDDRKREHWIATDGSMAVTAVKQAYSLWKRDAATPIEHELPGVDATRDLLGVRAHADVGRLRTVIAGHSTLGTRSSRRSPETIETDQCHELYQAEEAAKPGPPIEIPKRSAHAWGEDCYSSLRAEQWNWAEKSCLRGLAVATEAGTKGALLYNLGRIAEAQHAIPQAMEHYRDSLAARPGNATVKQRLAKLERGKPR